MWVGSAICGDTPPDSTVAEATVAAAAAAAAGCSSCLSYYADVVR